MLTEYAHFVLYPIHPTTLVNHRRGDIPETRTLQLLVEAIGTSTELRCNTEFNEMTH
jgi:hypothetical protein